jgi:hypothetical protein
MSDRNQAHRQNLSIVDDAPPTQPQGFPEAPTLEKVECEAQFLRLCSGDEAVHELYAHFGAKSADGLAETDRREFIRLANMDDDDRARVVGTKLAAPSDTASPEPQAPGYTFDQAKAALLSIRKRFGHHIAKEVLTSLGIDKLAPDAPNWMFADVVRFNEIEASCADEFRAALTADSIAFLEKLRPGGPWVLTAIVPDGAPTTTTTNNPSEARDFIRAHNGRSNLYYSCYPDPSQFGQKGSKGGRCRDRICARRS